MADQKKLTVNVINVKVIKIVNNRRVFLTEVKVVNK